ncbi:DUF4012 domain-containing protein [Cryobacterium melibiosiphilum]|uniref:DUF4012 domain-containing protein n=1 Tax=Cryobacterium melibiosiphilum TaxID=995039 RepID=A0A3A5MLP9_9MICO|nr:DUF4012 domain-containing protein [Cryobacterium melibiosiphilum]
MLWVVLGLLALLVLSTAWVGVRGYLAKGELESAIPLASTIQTQLLAADADAAAQSVNELQDHSTTAASLTSDPIWRAYEVLPWLGPNLTAVRELADVVNNVAQDAVGPLATVAASVDLEAFKPVDGALNLQPLVDAQGDVARASTALTAAGTQAARIDTRNTLDVVTDAATQLQTTVATTATTIASLNRAVQLLPAMLGADGPRNYVLLFQNPAELRAGGGIPGALALIHTENGRIELAEQANSGDFPRYDSPVLPLSPETQGIYGAITGTYIQNVTLTPNFTTSATLAAEMWRLQFGVTVDGVISLDPVTLSYLLAATGPITLPTGDVLSAENAVQLLLVDAYARYSDPAQQDAFFAAAAASVFEAVAGGSADPVKLIAALAQAGDEHRVLVYSAHEEEQSVLLQTTIAGALPVSTDLVKRLGVYFNDGTGAKMDTYLDVKYAVGQVTCRNDQRPEFGLDVTLTNTAPADAATSLPEYVTGGGSFGITPGNVNTLVSVYGSPDMQNLGVLRDDADVPYHPATDESYPVSTIAVDLAPGESTVLSFDWLGAEPFSGDLEVQSTPIIHLPETETLDFSC